MQGVSCSCTTYTVLLLLKQIEEMSSHAMKDVKVLLALCALGHDGLHVCRRDQDCI